VKLLGIVARVTEFRNSFSALVVKIRKEVLFYVECIEIEGHEFES
jgi:hypothetical protein